MPLVDIPDELAERVRRWVERWGGVADNTSARILDDLAALLPEPDPLDALAAEDGWEGDGTSVVWREIARGIRVRADGEVYVWGECSRQWDKSAGFICRDPAATVALARALRAALEQAEEGT
jgi:hypothetical protein